LGAVAIVLNNSATVSRITLKLLSGFSDENIVQKNKLCI